MVIDDANVGTLNSSKDKTGGAKQDAHACEVMYSLIVLLLMDSSSHFHPVPFFTMNSHKTEISKSMEMVHLTKALKISLNVQAF